MSILDDNFFETHWNLSKHMHSYYATMDGQLPIRVVGKFVRDMNKTQVDYHGNVFMPRDYWEIQAETLFDMNTLGAWLDQFLYLSKFETVEVISTRLKQMITINIVLFRKTVRKHELRPTFSLYIQIPQDMPGVNPKHTMYRYRFAVHNNELRSITDMYGSF